MCNRPGPEREFPNEAFLAAVRELPSPALTAMVASEVGCSEELARKRLRELKEQGRIEQETIGQAFVWKIA